MSVVSDWGFGCTTTISLDIATFGTATELVQADALKCRRCCPEGARALAVSAASGSCLVCYRRLTKTSL